MCKSIVNVDTFSNLENRNIKQVIVVSSVDGFPLGFAIYMGLVLVSFTCSDTAGIVA